MLYDLSEKYYLSFTKNSETTSKFVLRCGTLDLAFLCQSKYSNAKIQAFYLLLHCYSLKLIKHSIHQHGCFHQRLNRAKLVCLICSLQYIHNSFTCFCNNEITNKQGRRKHLKLGEHNTSRALSPLEKGAFSTIKRAFLCLLQKLGSTCPQCPQSYFYVNKNRDPFRMYQMSRDLGAVSKWGRGR